MMKAASIFTALSSLIISGAAQAGNLQDPTVEAPVEVIPYEDPHPWQGAYVGATLGYVLPGDDRIGITSRSGAGFGLGNLHIGGKMAGLRAGYRWQLAQFVFGPELSYEAGPVEDAFVNGNSGAYTELNHAMSLRLKAGSVWKVFNSFVYGTVGFSRAEFDYVVAGNPIQGPVAFNETYSTNGYILGLGFERPISDRLTVTGEYEYTNFGKDELTDSFGNTTLATPLFHTFKLGVNYNF
ncbi:outer membrane immunogenic protein [Aliiroseovarius halocynthiae]|uniref:Porin family protein n=1 Tax=Aliiroseovarius halocynthiae TaxID=985055 RepID=A0A545SM69_9RHOB|nr:outer membrane beta-barrel protein [Aliiroseovarius halocynthiae]TQV66057.1 porin family protein [Aliiroseovarius halocynthiae]SMR83235.1 outer membrane immunogenic protein [Aliiroseovarius halocynthiae]